MRDDSLDPDLPPDLARELSDEKAGALRRIGAHLQEVLERIAAIAATIDAGNVEDGEKLRQDHDALVDEAELWKWYLVVQRESIGLTTTHEVDEAYPIPQRLRRA